MTRTAVVICPGRGTYNKPELGYLHRHHADKMPMFQRFDALRAEAGQEGVTALDGAARFAVSTYSRGDVASPLIYAAALADAQSLADDIEVVAVTGNSMGWYIALAAAGALSAENGFRVVNTMGTLMQEHLIGGQLVYPFTDDSWADSAHQKQTLLQDVSDINAVEGQDLALSIDLGGMLVLAGNEAGLSAFSLEQYDASARGIAAVVVSPERRGELVPCVPESNAAFDAACAGEFVEHYGSRLFRRPLTEAEVAARVDAARGAAERLGDFYRGLEFTLVGMLVAPDFLLRIERSEADP